MVEASRADFGTGEWRLKQTENSVVSTRGSVNKLKGEVKGDQLSGSLFNEFDVESSMVLKISSDGHSFNGRWMWGTLKGMRKQ